MKFFNKGFGTKSNHKSKPRKSRADIIEQKLIKLCLLIFVLVLVFIAVNMFVNRNNIVSEQAHYMTLTQAEMGTKEIYGANKDASGNVTNLNGLTAISCFGDSFTNAPYDATASYAGVLSILAQRTIYNVATDNDSIFEMAARQGGRPIVVSPFIIPTTKASTEVLISNKNNVKLNFDFSKNGGLNPCTINGVEGLLSIINDRYCFTRAESGDETLILTPTEVESRAMQLRKNDICVFFLGDDDIYKTPEEAVEIYKDMIAYLGDNKNYIIVGPVKGEIAVLDAANKALSDAFGDNYLDLRSYLINNAAEVLHIKLSEDDQVLANNHIVPYVYFTGSKNFSAEGADAVGYAIYEKLTSLNFITNEN